MLLLGRAEGDVGRLLARWYFRLPARLRNRAMMPRTEHLQAIIFCPNDAISVLCVMKSQLFSYLMLCKVILRDVSISEKSHEVLLNGGSTRICDFIRIPYVGGLVMIDSV